MTTTGLRFQTKFEDHCGRARCRSCQTPGLLPVLDLGNMPLSDGMLTREQLCTEESHYPLQAAYCPKCTLVQILETVEPERLFCEDYPYYSSFSESWLEHARASARLLIESRGLTSDSLVVEPASNDGYLLKNFVEAGISVLGIDPAAGPAEAAQSIGVPTLCEFFSRELAERLVAEGRRADVILGNNVLAHVADTNGFVAGIATLLKEDGLAVIEVPYVRHLIEQCEFDTIYHEHLCYFSVTALEALFRRHDLSLNHIEPLKSHGGSLRLFVERRAAVQDSVRHMLAQENATGVDTYAYYERFTERVEGVCQALRELLGALKKEGRRIVAYGAAAKGTILLNYAGVGTDTIDFVMDRNVHKQGRYMPGVHVPIVEPQTLLRDMPDYVLILPWNLKNEIITQLAEFQDRGGRFIVPIPSPEIV